MHTFIKYILNKHFQLECMKCLKIGIIGVQMNRISFTEEEIILEMAGLEVGMENIRMSFE